MALPVPRSVSPSKVSSFTDCPLAFRFAVIDHRPEPPSPHAVKGTLVHRALERLFWRNAPGDRTPEVARLELAAAVAALDDDPEWAALALDPDQVRIFVADAETLLDNYFALEDPNQVQPVGVELGLEADVGGARLRGIIDRLDRRGLSDVEIAPGAIGADARAIGGAALPLIRNFGRDREVLLKDVMSQAS